MLWNVMIPDNTNRGFKKVVILALKKKGATHSATF